MERNKSAEDLIKSILNRLNMSEVMEEDLYDNIDHAELVAVLVRLLCTQMEVPLDFQHQVVMAAYLHDMKICQEYAVMNRRTIADRILTNLLGRGSAAPANRCIFGNPLQCLLQCCFPVITIAGIKMAALQVLYQNTATVLIIQFCCRMHV